MGNDDDRSLNLTPRHCRLLLELERKMNISDAAKSLGMAQSALSRQLADLESRLGTALFVRTTRSFEITPAGTALVRHAKIILNEVAAADQELTAITNGSSGRLRVGVASAAASSLLPEAIRIFRAQSDGAQVSLLIHHDVGVRLLRDVDIGAFDVVIGRFGDPGNLSVALFPLMTSALQVLVRAGHPLTRISRPSLTDLAEYEWILPKEGEPVRQALMTYLAGQQITPRPNVIESMSVTVINALLRTSDLISFYNKETAMVASEYGGLVTLPIDLPLPLDTVSYAIRRDVPVSALQQRFHQALEQAALKYKPSPGSDHAKE